MHPLELLWDEFDPAAWQARLALILEPLASYMPYLIIAACVFSGLGLLVIVLSTVRQSGSLSARSAPHQAREEEVAGRSTSFAVETEDVGLPAAARG